jgi:NitT/TauT family transport system ATP-binding protein
MRGEANVTVPVIDLQGVAVGFDDGPDVLRSVDLRVADKEFVSVIGPSGCGKSTILNVVAGLIPVRAGVARFRDTTVSGINTDVGYMTQGDTLLPWRTVADNVAMPLRLRKVARSEVKRRVEELLEMLDLAESARKYPAQLSGGMKRRALLARSMIYEPAVLLMDEPFAALDAQLRAQMHAELLRSVALTSQAVAFITHDIYEAVLLSDRVVVLGGRPGRVVAEVEVPFGRARELGSLPFDPEFVRLEKELHEALSSARDQAKPLVPGGSR